MTFRINKAKYKRWFHIFGQLLIIIYLSNVSRDIPFQFLFCLKTSSIELQAVLYVWRVDRTAGGNQVSRKSHDMFPVCWQCQTKRPTCIQSTEYMQLVHVQNILGMDPPELVRKCMNVCLSLCGVVSAHMCVCAGRNEYNTRHASLWCPHPHNQKATPEHKLGLSPAKEQLIPPSNRSLRVGPAERHAPPLRQTRGQIPEHTLLNIILHHNVPQCVRCGSLTIWRKILLKNQNNLRPCTSLEHFCSPV